MRREAALPRPFGSLLWRDHDAGRPGGPPGAAGRAGLQPSDRPGHGLRRLSKLRSVLANPLAGMDSSDY